MSSKQPVNKLRIPLCKSRNFSSTEIARTAEEVSINELFLTGYAMGAVQMIRDAASKYFGSRFKGINITSSNRAAYNDTVARAAANSHHIFRIDPKTKQLHVALDLQPIGVSLSEFYDFVKRNFRGEIILEADRGIVHYAPVGMEDEAFQQS